MADTTIITNGNGSKELREWETERIYMARSVAQHILDPMMTFAEIVKGYDQGKNIDLNLDEISAVLRLLVLGGHMDVMMSCSQGGFLCHITGKELEAYAHDWAKVIRKNDEGVA